MKKQKKRKQNKKKQQIKLNLNNKPLKQNQ